MLVTGFSRARTLRNCSEVLKMTLKQEAHSRIDQMSDDTLEILIEMIDLINRVKGPAASTEELSRDEKKSCFCSPPAR